MQNLISQINNDNISELISQIQHSPSLLYELNQQGINLLNYCIDNNKSETAVRLAILQENIDFQDYFGMTALHYAV